MPTEASPLVDLARQAGAHALTVFLLALVVAVALAGVAGAQVHRRRRGRDAADELPPPTLLRLVMAFATGFASIVGAGALFAAIAARLGPGNAMGLADQALADAIGQHTPRAALAAFSLLTHFGDPLMLAVLGLAVAVWLWRHRERLLAAGWLMALGGNAVLNPLLKQVFERTRPVHDHGLAQADGFSFPSGHSSGAMVAYGMLLYIALRLLPTRWHAAAAMGAVALVLGVACSRIFLQVHFASDVAAGLLSGLAWAGVCVAGLEFARQRRRRRPKT
ncbi:MAG: phosphatase PAP2 family protein [Variovorax sp.]